MVNALKPVVVDDTAYLAFARQIAAAPLDPYGFTLFWYTRPGPAFEVLCPPVLPYWLALGRVIGGEQVVWLKLWLFPFVWAMTASIDALLVRFARGVEGVMLPLIVLSPAVLPCVNLMLDIPAWGLGLAAVAVFVRGGRQRLVRRAVLCGVLAGLAMQTKYTMLTVPAVVLLYGVCWRRRGAAVIAAGVAVGLFAAWELLLVGLYGRSHFVFHTLDRTGGTGLIDWLRSKEWLLAPLAGHLGCLGVTTGWVVASALGCGSRGLATWAIAWAAGFVGLLVLPGQLTRGWVEGFWNVAGAGVLVVTVLGMVRLLGRRPWPDRYRWQRDDVFLCGWWLLELGAYFVLSPFPAARRVIGLAIVGGCVAARLLARCRCERRSRLPAWLVGGGVCVGPLIAALDTLDASPEIACAQSAYRLAADEVGLDGCWWFAGHWGFQYACERLGLRPLVPGETVVVPGDVLLLPVHPDDAGFHRPHVGSIPIRPPSDRVVRIGEVVWDDPIAGQTIPNFYGGVVPVRGREHPRLRVAIYRVTAPWRVGD